MTMSVQKIKSHAFMLKNVFRCKRIVGVSCCSLLIFIITGKYYMFISWTCMHLHTCAYCMYIKGVKKVRSALHHRISNHLKRKICWKIAFFMSLLSLVILYSLWQRVWHRMSSMVLCHTPPFCSSSPKISEGYWILKIIYSMTKYLIIHPIIYFLSSEST